MEIGDSNFEKYFNYKIGDSISYSGLKYKRSKTKFFGKGFITEPYTIEPFFDNKRRRYNVFKNFQKCKTTFSFKCGRGTKRFEKCSLKSSRVLLSEKKMSIFKR